MTPTAPVTPEVPAPPGTAQARPRRRLQAVVGHVVLDVLALGGLVCIVLVIAALVFKVTIVMFATGSMSPGIPTGSIAFVREIPATQMHVGDIVTVDRSPQLPVTHRVVQIVATHGDEVTFRLKGDANAQPDPADDTRSTVRLLLWSIPGLARVIVWFQNPFVLGAITLAVSALVTWAFWPREAARRPRRSAARDPEHEPGPS